MAQVLHGAALDMSLSAVHFGGQKRVEDGSCLAALSTALLHCQACIHSSNTACEMLWSKSAAEGSKVTQR